MGNCAGLGKLLAALALVAAWRAAPCAQDRPRCGLEVTPFVAAGSPQSSAIGVTFDVPFTRLFSVEAEVGVDEGGGRRFTADLSLIYWLPPVEGVQPYVAAGLGLREYGFPITWTEGSVLTARRADAAVNGGGVGAPRGHRWSVRTDGGWRGGEGEAPEHGRVFTAVGLRAR